MKDCVTAWLVLVSSFCLPSAVSSVPLLLIFALVILVGFS